MKKHNTHLMHRCLTPYFTELYNYHSKNLRKNLCILLVWLLAAPLSAFAANIFIEDNQSTIAIVGPIKNGDYSNIQNAILDVGPNISTVYISSPGGDAIEATKIGKLIRKQGLATHVPYSIAGKPVCPRNIAPSKDCTCLSACLLIYIAGIERKGDYIGVHRIYLEQDATKKLDIDASVNLTTKLTEFMNSYLDSMSAPSSLRDRIHSASPNEVDILEPEYVNKYLDGFIPEYEDWILAKCGDSRMLIREMSKSKTSYEKWEPELDRISNCEYELLYGARIKKYYELRSENPLPQVKLDNHKLLTEDQATELRKLLKKNN